MTTGAEHLRVLYVDLAPGVGGSLISLSLLVQALDKRRFEPTVILAAGQPYAERLAELGARVLTVPGRAGVNSPGADTPAVARARRGRLARWLRASPRREVWLHRMGFLVRELPPALAMADTLYRVLARERPALVHLNDAVAVSRPGILAAWRAGIPCLVHVRAFAPLNGLDRWLVRRAAGCIFISQATAAFQAGQGGRARRSWVIPNGLELGAFARMPAAAEARRSLGLVTAGPVVGAVGRLVAWKGHDVLLRAVALLRPEWPNLEAVIVGAPEARDPRPLAALQQLAAELGLGGRAHFVGYRSDIPQVLAAFDVLVHSAIEPEPFGRVIIEGLAARVPVVAARAGAVPEILTDGVDGLLVSPGDPAELARAIGRLLADRDLAARLAAAGRARVEQTFTAEGVARAVERVYEELLCS